MKRILQLVFLFFIIAFFSGCIEVHTTVNLNKDGSGTLKEKVLMSGAMVSMLKQFANSFSEDSTKKPEGQQEFNLFNEDEIKNKAADLGKGVKYVSGKPIKEGDREGYIATYSFKDINKLLLDQNPGNFVPMGSDENADSTESKEILTFNFTPGSISKLVISIPKSEKFNNEDNEEQTDTTENDSENVDQMKMFMKDLKIVTDIHFNGKIVNTNATYVKGSDVTLFKMDFNELLKDPQKLKELKKENPKSLDEMRKVLKNVPGIEMELNDQVTVDFK
jgi:hypothetical protein